MGIFHHPQKEIYMDRPKFVTNLIRRQKGLASLKHKEVAIFNIDGTYGTYQIKVGPVDPMNHSRSIEIVGQIHHLFATKNNVHPLPTRQEIDNNLRGTVIMRDVTVPLFDEKGQGIAVQIKQPNGIHPMKNINLAGEDGDKIITGLGTNEKMANEAYRIVQE